MTRSPSDHGHPQSASGAQAPDRAVRVMTVGVLVEAAALGLAGLWSVMLLVTGRSVDGALGGFLAVFCLGVAAGLVGAARALGRSGTWARGTVVTWQLLQGATALTVLQAVTSQSSPAVTVGAWCAVGLSALVLTALAVVLARRSPSA